jgi:peptidoglycan/LPS O-acetylase OafA/YrhL
MKSLAPDPARTIMSSSLSNRHIPALDGIRGLAILLVLLHHFAIYGDIQRKVFVDKLFYVVTMPGWCGVDLFFVLSGFLITGILYDAKGSKFFFRNFYMRRCLRIFPLYYGVLAIFFVVLPLFFTTGRSYELLLQDQAWYWGYVVNIKTAIEGWPEFLAIGHFWSLAVEEQFYFVWPFVVFLLGRRTLIKVCLACMVGAFILRIGLTWAGNPLAAYVLAPARMDALALGGLLALLARHPDGLLRWRSHAWCIGGGAGGVLAAFFVWKRSLNELDVWVVTLGYTLLAVFFGSILTVVLTSSQGSVLKNLFSRRPLGLLGRYSYALYVFHHPIVILVRKKLFTVPELPTFFGSQLAGQFLFILIGGGISLLVALASWHLYEVHFLKLKDRFSSSPKVSGSAVSRKLGFVRLSEDPNASKTQ